MRLCGSRVITGCLAVLISVLAAGNLDAAPKRRRRRRPAPTPVEKAVGNTLEERIGSLINGSVSRASEASIEIVEIESGKVVGQKNAHEPLAPASNMKLFTTAAAIDLLKPSFEVTTTIYIRGNIDASGTLDGDVKIVGHGDPTIGGRFHDGQATAVLEEWATDLQRAGIKTVRGDLIFEYGYFDTEYVHPTWPVDQLVNWYEAPVSAFSMQEGCVQVRVTPSRPGRQCVVQLEPPTDFLDVQNSCVTGRGMPFITRPRNSNTIIVRGGVPSRSGATEVFVSVEDPIHYFATVTAETFIRSGLRMEGRIVVTPHDPRSDWKPVSQHTTPLNIIVYVINKKSQNHYAEQLVKMIGAETKKSGTWEAGTSAVTDWLTEKLGVSADEYHQVDGSGMS
ncbi:MAG: D-alanyl-D-alanine carboxypeptidase/D-alanyl-D-alanine-endopeptidase, partial [Actinomycetota bacterium]